MDQARSSLLALMLVAAATGGLWFAYERLGGGSHIDSLPATGAGRALSPAEPAPASAVPLQPETSGQPGTTVRGRVSEVYVRVQDKVFVALDRAPPHQHEPGNLFVEIEYPEALATGAVGGYGLLGAEFEGVRVGDIVALRLARKHEPKLFPVREVTRVTEVIAKRDSEMARTYQRVIVARKGTGTTTARVTPAPTLQEALRSAGQ